MQKTPQLQPERHASAALQMPPKQKNATSSSPSNSSAPGAVLSVTPGTAPASAAANAPLHRGTVKGAATRVAAAIAAEKVATAPAPALAPAPPRPVDLQAVQAALRAPGLVTIAPLTFNQLMNARDSSCAFAHSEKFWMMAYPIFTPKLPNRCQKGPESKTLILLHVAASLQQLSCTFQMLPGSNRRPLRYQHNALPTAPYPPRTGAIAVFVYNKPFEKQL